MQTESFYRRLIADAAALAWHHKTLWLFGILASILNSGGVFETAIRCLREAGSATLSWSTITDSLLPGSSVIGIIQEAASINNYRPSTTIIAIGTIVLLLLGSIALSVIAQGGLIASSVKFAQSKLSFFPSHKLSFLQRYLELGIHGIRSFLTVLGVNLLGKLALLALSILVALPILIIPNLSQTVKSIISALTLIVFVPASMIISALAILAICSVVLHQEKLKPALKRALDLLHREWFVILETAIFLLLATLGIAFLVTAVAKLLIIPFYTYIFASTFFDSISAVIFFQSLFAFVATLFFLAAAGYIVAFQYVAWSLLYLRLTSAVFSLSALKRHLLVPFRRWFKS